MDSTRREGGRWTTGGLSKDVTEILGQLDTKRKVPKVVRESEDRLK